MFCVSCFLSCSLLVLHTLKKILFALIHCGVVQFIIWRDTHVIWCDFHNCDRKTALLEVSNMNINRTHNVGTSKSLNNFLTNVTWINRIKLKYLERLRSHVVLCMMNSKNKPKYTNISQGNVKYQSSCD